MHYFKDDLNHFNKILSWSTHCGSRLFIEKIITNNYQLDIQHIKIQIYVQSVPRENDRKFRFLRYLKSNTDTGNSYIRYTLYEKHDGVRISVHNQYCSIEENMNKQPWLLLSPLSIWMLDPVSIFVTRWVCHRIYVCTPGRRYTICVRVISSYPSYTWHFSINSLKWNIRRRFCHAFLTLILIAMNGEMFIIDEYKLIMCRHWSNNKLKIPGKRLFLFYH